MTATYKKKLKLRFGGGGCEQQPKRPVPTVVRDVSDLNEVADGDRVEVDFVQEVPQLLLRHLAVVVCAAGFTHTHHTHTCV